MKNFKLKHTLIGIAALSLFVPVASHAQNSKGQWIFDGFGRSTKDGNGSRCVSSGGTDHAFASEDCDQSSGAMAKNTATETTMTKPAAESQAAPAETASVAAAEPAAAPAATVAAAGNVGDVVPGTVRAGVVRDANGAIVRDGANRFCVWDNRWAPGVSGENCEDKAMATAAAAEPAEAPAPQPEQELAQRIDMPPPEVDPASLAAAPAAASQMTEEKPAEVAATDNLTDRSPGQTPPATAPTSEPAAIVDNDLPEFPVTKYSVEDAPKDTETTALNDTAPGVAPPMDRKEETPPVVDNEPAKFPENKYTIDETPAAPPKREPEVVAAAPKTVLANFQMEKAKLFEFNSAKLRKGALSQIDTLVDTLNGANDYGTVTVVGHTDRIGSDKYNQKLSERRANAVRTYLVSKGVSADKIAAEGRGESDPVTASGDCDELKGKKLRACLAPDRRVVVEAAGTLPSSTN